jgi:DNA-binding MarR family transcriptional regulator
MTTKHIIHALITAARHKIGLREFALLAVASQNDTTHMVAEATGWDNRNIQSRVTKLKEKGLLATEKNDGTMRKIIVTAKGQAILNEAFSAPEQ